MINAGFVHPGHRFVPVYKPLQDMAVQSNQSVHVGVCCDGPLCSAGRGYYAYIRGIRYKCAVCHDLDFCANCEASPANEHNRTHPLIKLKTPVRHVSVSTSGEHHDGQRMPVMGDRSSTTCRGTETVPSVQENAMNTVQTVVDVKPVDPVPDEKEEKHAEPHVKEIPTPIPAEIILNEKDLKAVFLRDTVQDGTIFTANQVFQQTWVLRNEGTVAWPAGCSVKFVGGDYMGHIDPTHPAGVSELISASESTICYAPLEPGQEFSFTVLLRTPPRAGKVISYWRLTTPTGLKFGHRLWCDVNVRLIEPETKVETSAPVETKVGTSAEKSLEEHSEASQESSLMIFPKLEKESPVASMHETSQSDVASQPETQGSADEFEDAEDLEWDASDDGFMTDEEYDILDASDEEYLETQQKKLIKK